MAFKPKVLVAQADTEFRRLGRLLLPGIFDGEHYFRLAPSPAGTRFTQGERFSGLLVPLFKSQLSTQTLAGFQAMNDALRRHVEATAAP